METGPVLNENSIKSEIFKKQTITPITDPSIVSLPVPQLALPSLPTCRYVGGKQIKNKRARTRSPLSISLSKHKPEMQAMSFFLKHLQKVSPELIDWQTSLLDNV